MMMKWIDLGQVLHGNKHELVKGWIWGEREKRSIRDEFQVLGSMKTRWLGHF